MEPSNDPITLSHAISTLDRKVEKLHRKELSSCACTVPVKYYSQYFHQVCSCFHTVHVLRARALRLSLAKWHGRNPSCEDSNERHQQPHNQGFGIRISITTSLQPTNLNCSSIAAAAAANDKLSPCCIVTGSISRC